MRKGYSLFILFLLPILSFSQANYTLDADFLQAYQSSLNGKDCNFFTSVGPYDVKAMYAVLKKDSVNLYKDLIFKNTNPMIGDSQKFGLNIFPLFAAEGGYDAYGHSATYSSYGGIHADGNIGHKVSYSVNYIGGYIKAPSFEDSIIKNTRVVPGLGYAYGSPANGYSYQYLDAYLSYSPNDIFNFQVGKGKQFLGDGYRSLFLSDVSNSYPYFKITTTIWHIQYTSIFTVMRDVEASSGLQKDWTLKYGSFHYLDWNVSKRINIGLFETVIWKGNQGYNVRSFDINYLNPVIFYRPVEFSLGSPDNVLLGPSFRIKVAKHAQFYSQVMIDEFVLHDIIKRDGWWGNKQGVQVGFKQFDLFRVKGLSFQTEVNYVRPYTYSHGNEQQNYGNFGQPLADPEGANFVESVSFLTYSHKNFLLQGKLLITHYGADSGGVDYGQNIFISYDQHPNDYGNYVGQGVSTYLGIVGLRAAYIISPRMDIKAELGIEERMVKVAAVTTNYPYIYMGIKTSLGNLYNDFK